MFRDMWDRTLSRTVVACAATALFARIAVAVFAFDHGGEEYWEYGELAKNVIAGKGYALYYFAGDSLEYRYASDATPFASAFMPPGYVGVLVPFILLPDLVLRNTLLVILQIVSSLFTLWILCWTTQKYIGHRTSIFTGVLFALLPDLAYAPVSFTPIALTQALTALLLLLWYQFQDESSGQTCRAINVGLVGGTACLFRSEYALLVGLLVLVLLRRGALQQALIVLAVVAALIAPWTVRNGATFGELIPLTTNVGQNLYRGNNTTEIGAWRDDSIVARSRNLPRDHRFEPALNRVYVDAVVEAWRHEPATLALLLPQKLWDLWVYSTVQDRAGMWVHRWASGIFFILFIIGVASLKDRSRHSFYWIYAVAATIVGVVFFSLPRHQSLLHAALVPIAGHGLRHAYDRVQGWLGRSSIGKASS